jgi:hypothetical protein
VFARGLCVGVSGRESAAMQRDRKLQPPGQVSKHDEVGYRVNQKKYTSVAAAYTPLLSLQSHSREFLSPAFSRHQVPVDGSPVKVVQSVHTTLCGVY